MNLKNFEDKRWSHAIQQLVFRHKKALELIDRGEVLDMGCGDGLFLFELKKKGIDGVGMDISEVAVKKCLKKGINASVLDFSREEIPLKYKKFEYATFLDVLEHVYDPFGLIKKASKVSKKIIFAVPNFNSLPARLQMLRGKVPENMKPHKGHVYWFNYKTIKDIEKKGFVIKKITANTFWENRLIIGKILKYFLKRYPSIFALTFVVLVESQ